MEKETKKRVLKKYIFVSFLLIATAVAILLMIRYNVEGEQNMPFKLSKIEIQSTLDRQSKEGENLWDLKLNQNNDVYIHIEKNKDENEDEKIKNIKITRMAQTSKAKRGTIAVLLPTSNNVNTVFLASEQNYIDKTIEYNGNTINNLERQEICENGGMIAIRISNQNIGEYISNEGDKIVYDKSLLEKAGIEEEELKLTMELDILIETTEDKKYKGTVALDLPVGSFEGRGVINNTITELNDVIFKREN